MAFLEHPAFTSPKRKDAVLWRYMPFDKFVSLLKDRSLFMCRADRFQDKHEGTYPKGNSIIPKSLLDLSDEHKPLCSGAIVKWMRQWTYISSWHVNSEESEAMWKLYGATTGASVAVCSTYAHMSEAISTADACMAGMVQYVDFASAAIPHDNWFYPYLYKRTAFKHEEEFRVVRQELPRIGAAPRSRLDIDRDNSIHGIQQPVDIEELIQEVRVSPLAQEWFADVVTATIGKFGFTFPVSRSPLYDEPCY